MRRHPGESRGPEDLEKTLDSDPGSRLKNAAGMTYRRNDEQWPSTITIGLKVNSIGG